MTKCKCVIKITWCLIIIKFFFIVYRNSIECAQDSSLFIIDYFISIRFFRQWKFLFPKFKTNYDNSQVMCKRSRRFFKLISTTLFLRWRANLVVAKKELENVFSRQPTQICRTFNSWWLFRRLHKKWLKYPIKFCFRTWILCFFNGIMLLLKFLIWCLYKNNSFIRYTKIYLRIKIRYYNLFCSGNFYSN